MIELRSTECILVACQPSSETSLCKIINQRLTQLTEDGGGDVADIAHFLIVQAGDDDRSVKGELGFSILENLVDGARFGNPEFEPSWEWIMRHEGWFELVYVLSDDGFGWVVLIQDDEAVDADLLAVCREYAPAT